MKEFELSAVVFLLANIFVGLFRVLRGPSRADRMLAAQLFGTTGVACLLLMSEIFAEPALRDVALAFALLAAVAAVGFVTQERQ